MRPGIPGPLQLNPDKVRLMSMFMGKKMPKVANIFPKLGSGKGMPYAGGMSPLKMGGGHMGMGMGLPGRPMGGGMPGLF